MKSNFAAILLIAVASAVNIKQEGPNVSHESHLLPSFYPPQCEKWLEDCYDNNRPHCFEQM